MASTKSFRKSEAPRKASQDRFPSKALVLIVSVGLLVSQCSINKPTAPGWNVKLTVPLTNKYYSLATLIEKMDEPYLKVDSTGDPGFYFEEEMDTIRLSGKLRCDSTSFRFRDTLGVINIQTSESKQMTLFATEFHSGPYGVVPPCTVSIANDLDTFSTFQEVTAEEAFATIILSNHLGLSLDWVQIKIVDRSRDDTLQTVTVENGVSTGDSVARKAVFTDKTFSNRLGFVIQAFTPGGRVQNFDDKYLSLSLTLDSLKVTEGMVEVPSFSVSQEDSIILLTRSVIDSARIRSGILSLDLGNFSNLETDVQADFPEFEKNRESLSFVAHLPALQRDRVNLVLDGYDFRPRHGNDVRVHTTIRSTGSESTLTHFGSSDSIGVNATVSEILFSQISGVIESTRIGIEPITRRLDIPRGFESAHLADASLSLMVHNGVDLPANLSVTVQGEKGQNLSFQSEIEAGGPLGTSVTSIFEDQIASLLSPVPESLFVSGEIICGDGRSRGTVREEDFFFGKMTVSSPLHLILDSCEVQMDPDSDQVDDQVKRLIEDEINSTRLVLKVESHLPLGAKAKIYVSQSQASLFSHPDLVIGPIEVSPGVLNGDGSVRESRSFQTEITLTHQELQVFTSKSFYAVGALDFPGTNGQSIKASPADFIRVVAYLELNVKTKKD
ncbi:MAG: hypothetical protein WCE90_02855 [Candidatus Zixiibacteriota bacterium]